MLGSYRSIIFAIVGWLKANWLNTCIAVAALSVIALAVHTGRSWQAVYERTAAERTREYQDYAYRPALRACGSVPTLNQAKCIADAREAERSNARDEHDLEAQRVTALWTGIMGIAAVTGMMLSAIGVWLVFTTFRETRKATVIATDSLEAVIDSERAKICMADSALVGKAPNEPHKLAISIVLNNIGKSNATVRLIYWSAARDANWPETFDHIRDVSLAAPEKGNLKIDYLRYHIAVPETHFVSGTVVYETILGRTFKTHFSYRVSQPFAESGAPLSVWYANYRRWPGQPDDT